MSWQALKWAYATEITPRGSAAKSVLVALSYKHKHETDQCYPSMATICEMTSMDIKTVRAALRRLKEDQLIEIFVDPRGGKSYRLCLESHGPVRVPNTEGGTKYGRVPNTDSEGTKYGVLRVPNTVPNRHDRQDRHYESGENREKCKTQSTRKTTLEHDLNDTTWAN